MIPGFSAFIMYNRIPRAKALDNENRQRVLDAIREDPGVRVGTIAARLGLGPATVRWHVRVLERFRLVEIAGGAQRRYFVTGQVGSLQEKNAITAASTHSLKRALGLVQERGEVQLSHLVASLGLSHSLASWSVSKLERAGLVRRRREGRRVIVTSAIPTASVRENAEEASVCC